METTTQFKTSYIHTNVYRLLFRNCIRANGPSAPSRKPRTVVKKVAKFVKFNPLDYFWRRSKPTPIRSAIICICRLDSKHMLTSKCNGVFPSHRFKSFRLFYCVQKWCFRRVRICESWDVCQLNVFMWFLFQFFFFDFASKRWWMVSIAWNWDARSVITGPRRVIRVLLASRKTFFLHLELLAILIWSFN